MDIKSFITQEGRGAATKLASDLGISPSYLSQLAGGQSTISPERCVQIEKATHGKVTRRDLRPNDWNRIWPELERRTKKRS